MRLKLHLVLGIFCLMTTFLSAQTPVCQPDSVKYRDSVSGVYPLPYVPVTRPNAGIDKAACIGKAYSFVWTVKMGDTVTVPNPFGGGTISAPVDSITIGKTASIQGLPPGITYACNPPSCVFKRKTNGCVALIGTALATDTVKTYPLVITAKAFPGGIYASFFPSGYEGTLPGSFAEGSYNLALYAANDSRCRVATNDLTEVSAMTATPNPTNGKTTIRIESTVSDKFQFILTDLLGRTIQTRPLSIEAGQNSFELDVTKLSNGIYIYNLTKGNRIMSNKLIVNQ
jgi:Secretion system C-terminal sorting domain